MNLQPVACTIAARNYFAFAMTLARSYVANHPGSPFFVLVVDGPPEGALLDEGIHLLGADELGFAHLRELAFKYDVIELCTALKPTLLRFLLERVGATSAMYLDPDILVCRTLTEVPASLQDASLLLTPHIVRPIPLDGRKPSEMDVLMTGAYNLGFIAVSRCEETSAFLDWWEERLRDGCRMDPGGRYFVDQKWVDYAPSLFPSTRLLRDDTYNVATWNLNSRCLDRDGEGFLVNGRPLSFFHFSGFDPKRRCFRSQPQARISIEPGGALEALVENYARLFDANAATFGTGQAYGYARFSNGKPIPNAMRQLYASIPADVRERFGDPFCAGGEDSFYQWAITADTREGDLSPFLMAVYRSRPDVMAAFPDVWGEHREAFVTWITNTGCNEMALDPDLIRARGAVPVALDATVPEASLVVTQVVLSRAVSDELIGRWIDLPRAGLGTRDQTFPVSGWILGRSAPLVGIEVVRAGVVIGTAPLNISRPDVAGMYPDIYHAVRCGFRMTIGIVPESGGHFAVQAVLPDQRRLTIATIEIRPRDSAMRS